jgi:hypothetical protein
MDIEINAYGKQVKISGIDCDEAEDCVEVAYDLWSRLEKPTPPPPIEGIESSGGGHAERAYRPMGYADVSYGERLNVK